MSVKIRQRLERMIARRFILNALAAGYVISVYDGGEIALTRGTRAKDILAAMFSTDEDQLILYRPGEDKRAGWVLFIYGNDGWDVINDYSTRLEPLMAGAAALADKYS